MNPIPLIFLFGPPGVGKTTLGGRACAALGLEFLDLTSPPAWRPAGDLTEEADLGRISQVVVDRTADVVALPWGLQQERRVLTLARRSGVALFLWAHPEDMQARSGRAEPLFTPVPRLKVRGGFGRNGTGCREFRHLDRACSETLLLVNLPLEAAAEAVKNCIAALREDDDASPTEREGLAAWAEYWSGAFDVSPRTTEVIVDAMARYLGHLRAKGASPRTLNGVCSDLNAAGLLVVMYGAESTAHVLCEFDSPPYTYEFKRKCTDSPALVARYCRNLEGFGRFLREHGDARSAKHDPGGR